MKENHKILLHRNCGFFSDFLTGLAGIMYCVDNNHNFYVEWSNNYYNHMNSGNLFDKYFNQDLTGSESFNHVYHEITPYGYYFPFNNKTNQELFDMFKHPSDILKEYNILNNEHFNSIDTSIIDNHNVLGLHKRGTDHSGHGPIMSDIDVLSLLNDEFKKNSYDKIFLITDDLKSFDFYKKELGDTLITTNSVKIDSQLGIHTSYASDGHTMATDVIRDSYLLSKTKFKLITKSNVSSFSLLCNLDVDNWRYIDDHVFYN